ncbi:hypothetical protein SAMN05444166_6923 [Singulisphaera sp. GP187]|nr:hypothetical protein SAMN05444166_6923 [Singulisphaera sp. GP187]
MTGMVEVGVTCKTAADRNRAPCRKRHANPPKDFRDTILTYHMGRYHH